MFVNKVALATSADDSCFFAAANVYGRPLYMVVGSVETMQIYEPNKDNVKVFLYLLFLFVAYFVTKLTAI